MRSLSICVRICHELASGEAALSNDESITYAHLFAGITKLEDFLDAKVLQEIGLPGDQVSVYQQEATSVLELFRQFKLNPRQTRHALRMAIRDEGYHARAFSLPPSSRIAYDRAAQIADHANSSTVNVGHLLAALLEIKTGAIHAILERQGVDIEALHEAAANLTLSSSGGSSTSYLAKYGVDLTALAREGKLPEAIGRREEMLQVVRALGRQTKNNPVLLGEPGVGKTAIVEGLARRIADGNIDPDFQKARIIQINAGGLVAGTKYRGEFEERFQGIIDEAIRTPNLILFIDELHMLVGAGKVEGGGTDAANMLKPALARGQIKLIGATTFDEYREYIEKDAALERRFQPIKVEEPSPDDTRAILEGLRAKLEQHHHVTIDDSAIKAAVELSIRYIPERRLPDKAYDTLDEACARNRYRFISFRGTQDSQSASGGSITEETVRQVIAEKTGIPVANLTDEQSSRIIHMAKTLEKEVIGQSEAVQAITKAIQRSYAGLQDASKPIGVFLFVGPTGVGKTELAKAVAKFLFGSPDRMIRLDMTEYGDKYSTSRLVGAAPGYVGYDQGGQLTEALRRTPYSVVLLDEVEKSHPDVMNIFLQVFGDGRLTDGQGRVIDARNAIFIMTSNLGFKKPLGLAPGTERIQEVQESLHGYFQPEMINRIDEIVLFQPLQPGHIRQILRLRLEKLRATLRDSHNVQLTIAEDAIDWLAQQGYSEDFGARPMARLLNDKLVNPVSELLLSGQITGTGGTVNVELADNNLRIGFD